MVRSLFALLAFFPLAAFAGERHIFRFGGSIPVSF